ncbi:UDP-glucose 6-dehydrogenase YwqF [Clavibacter michiganensis]|uniref:UDP-glucose 6-dehydrogenase YwqF n=1 Tax=Clavibacter michiganensis TaxID=28447 RepID=A0A251XU37_9MICO|nr:UDP-glucose 6-dehydrogenase YwqF [Clavibacter michiganensis]
MRISVIGCGYLGTVHAACMSRLGHDVVAIDVDAEKIASLQQGVAPFFEPGLPELLREELDTGRLRFSTDAAQVAGARVHFIAVGTPQKRGRTPPISHTSTPPSNPSCPTCPRATSSPESRLSQSVPRAASQSTSTRGYPTPR